MADPIGTVYVNVKPKLDDKFSDSLADEASKDVDKKQSVWNSVGAKVGVAVGVGFAAKKAFDIGSEAFAAAEESQKVAAQTRAAIESTGGAANVTAGQIDKLSNAISRKTGIDDEAIASGANLLLTFTNVKNEVGDGAKIFDRATGMLADMGAAMGTDASGSAIQLGKALNDPIKGISALTRVGVTFDDAQKAQIKTMVEAGDVAGAQTIILDELAKEFGGSAEAQATSADKAKVAMGNLTESVGGLLVPAVSFFADVLSTKVIPATESVVGWLDKHKAVAYILGGVIGTVAAIMAGFAIAEGVATVATQVHTVATGVATGAQWLFNAAVSANPLALFVLAIAAVGAALVLAYEKVGWFRDGIDSILGFLKGMWNWVSDNWPLLLAILTGPFGLAVLFIKDHWDDIVDFVSKLPGRIGSAASGMWDGIKDAFKSAINAIIRAWNGLEFKLPGVDAGPFHIGGFTLGVPDIPLLAAQGAFLDRATLMVGGERGPEVVSPIPTLYNTARRAFEDAMANGTTGRAPLVGGDLVLQGTETDTAIDELERWWWTKTAGSGGRAA